MKDFPVFIKDFTYHYYVKDLQWLSSSGTMKLPKRAMNKME